MDLCKSFSYLQKLNRLTGLVWAHRGNVVFQNTPEITSLGFSTKMCRNYLKPIWASLPIWIWIWPDCLPSEHNPVYCVVEGKNSKHILTRDLGEQLRRDQTCGAVGQLVSESVTVQWVSESWIVSDLELSHLQALRACLIVVEAFSAVVGNLIN